MSDEPSGWPSAARTIVWVIVIKRRGGHLAIEDDPRWAEMTNPILRAVPTADVS